MKSLTVKVKKETKRKRVFNNKLIIIIIIMLTLRTLKSRLSCGTKGRKERVCCLFYIYVTSLACLLGSFSRLGGNQSSGSPSPSPFNTVLPYLPSRSAPSFIHFVCYLTCSIRSAAFDSLLISFSL